MSYVLHMTCMYIYIYTYIHSIKASKHKKVRIALHVSSKQALHEKVRIAYTRSPLQDSRLFGPRPWKVLATTYDKTKKKTISEQPRPWRKSCEREFVYGDRVYSHLLGDSLLCSDYTSFEHAELSCNCNDMALTVTRCPLIVRGFPLIVTGCYLICYYCYICIFTYIYIYCKESSFSCKGI